MKRILKIAALALVLVLGSSLRNAVSAQYYSDRNVTYQDFYDDLSPYGRWVDYPGMGYVWIPDAGPDFRPYSTNGHWVWTDDYEWMWVSDYDWGWAPFHYGRWDFDSYYGWYWVPGYEWSPAWVAWRDGGDYYGWAPLRPGITISINFNIGSYSPPFDFWCFAPRRYITSPRIYDYCVDRRQNVTIINYTTIIVNNYHYNDNYGFRSGPRRYDAERYCGRISPVRFRESYRPGRSEFRNNEVTIYRPQVRRDEDRRFAPRSFERYDRSNNDDNGGFRRNNNDQSNSNRVFERRNDDTRQPQSNNGNNNNFPDRRGFGRRDDQVNQQQNNNGNSNNVPERRRFDRRDDQGNQQQNNNRNGNNFPDRRKFDRSNNPGNQQQNNNGNNNNFPDRRQFDRNNNNNGNNNNTPVYQPEVRRNDNNRPQRQPQQEIRQYQERQQQPRQFERRENGNNQQNNNSRNNGGGGNNRRRF